MLCSVSWVQCHMASRAALDPGAQPSHPTLQMGLPACLPPTPLPCQRHKPRCYPTIRPSGFKFTGAPKPQISGTSTWGWDRGKFRELPRQGWEKAEGPGHLEVGSGYFQRMDAPQDCFSCTQGELKVFPSLAPGSLLVQKLDGRRGGPHPPHTHRGSQTMTTCLSPSHLPFSMPARSFFFLGLWDIFHPLMRQGLSRERRWYKERWQPLSPGPSPPCSPTIPRTWGEADPPKGLEIPVPPPVPEGPSRDPASLDRMTQWQATSVSPQPAGDSSLGTGNKSASTKASASREQATPSPLSPTSLRGRSPSKQALNLQVRESAPAYDSLP